MFACPAAAITMSASRIIFSGSLVCECTIVTVASSLSSSRETGNPTILLRPTTTAFLPFMLMPLRDRSSRQPCSRNRASQKCPNNDAVHPYKYVAYHETNYENFYIKPFKCSRPKYIALGVHGRNRGSLPFIASLPIFKG